MELWGDLLHQGATARAVARRSGCSTTAVALAPPGRRSLTPLGCRGISGPGLVQRVSWELLSGRCPTAGRARTKTSRDHLAGVALESRDDARMGDIDDELRSATFSV